MGTVSVVGAISQVVGEDGGHDGTYYECSDDTYYDQ
jgi:hypothetical protein